MANSNAIARYIGKLRPDKELFGRRKGCPKLRQGGDWGEMMVDS